MIQTATLLTDSFLQIAGAKSQPQTPATYSAEQERVLPSFISRASQLVYKDKVHLSFNVSERFESYFILIKGLIEFHRPKEVQFTFNRSERTFEVSTSTQFLDFVFSFLDKVQTWLSKEIQFKASLKKIIQFEDQYRAERSALYGSFLKA